MMLGLLSALMRFQDRLVALLGNSVEGRRQVVADMLHRDGREVTAYWLQLVVAVGIATMGLTLGSSAVIIGAMLVAPLMGPIVALALGLAAGSPFLVVRSTVRIAASVAVTVAGAAVITRLLPFHELTPELAARISPTVLDLITATFCALAGVYAAIRAGSGAITTAAGTSIGISLVPPLCASGYGVGTGSLGIASSAALLFLTNLVAIVVVGTAAFVASGFNRVDVRSLEREHLAAEHRGGLTRSLVVSLARFFGSRGGITVRFVMPLLLLGAVYIPLRRALDEVVWEVKVRSTIKQAIARDVHHLVQSHVQVEHHRAELLLVILGTPLDAEKLKTTLTAEVTPVAGGEPRIDVRAIPDAKEFAGLESSLLSSQRQPPVPEAPPPVPPRARLDAAADLVSSEVAQRWPATTVGQPLRVSLGGNGQRLVVRVVHLGQPLDAAGREAFLRSLSLALGPVELDDAAIPQELGGFDDGGLGALSQLASAVRSTESAPDVSICATRPRPKKTRKKGAPREEDQSVAIEQLLSEATRSAVVEGDDWRVRFVTGDCGTTPDGGSAAVVDGGS
jgi:uncharacterized hydrophobic protein (TIGR00271 family)